MLEKLEEHAAEGYLNLCSPESEGDYLSPLKASIRIAKSLCIMSENDILKKLNKDGDIEIAFPRFFGALNSFVKDTQEFKRCASRLDPD